MSSELPDVIETYQQAHDRRDVDAALATFTSDATVIDDSETYVGTERVRWFLGHAASEFTFTRTLSGVEDQGDGVHLVRNRIVGNLPGGEVDLQYRFRLRDGLIEHLEIAP